MLADPNRRLAFNQLKATCIYCVPFAMWAESVWVPSPRAGWIKTVYRILTRQTLMVVSVIYLSSSGHSGNFKFPWLDWRRVSSLLIPCNLAASIRHVPSLPVDQSKTIVIKCKTGRLMVGCSPGEQDWKTLSLGHWLFSFFDNSRKNNGQAFGGTFAPKLCPHYNHCPCARPAHAAESGPLALLQVLPNNRSQMLK